MAYYRLEYFTRPKGDISAKELDRFNDKVVREIILNRPIRGLEVHFLRTQLGLSLEKFGRILDINSTTILKWEKKEKDRLSKSNEVYFRLVLGNELDIELSADIEELLPKVG